MEARNPSGQDSFSARRMSPIRPMLRANSHFVLKQALRRGCDHAPHDESLAQSLQG